MLQREADELDVDGVPVDALAAVALAAVPFIGLGLGEGVLKPAARTVGGTVAQKRRKASAASVRAMHKWYGLNRGWRTVRLPQRP